MNLLPFTVYRSSLGDCTNGGVSAKVTTVYVEDPHGFISPEGVDPALVFRAERNIGGSAYSRLIPVVDKPGLIGPMSGGNIASTSDSRGNGYSYHIHDRWETSEQYRSLSV